MITREDFFDAEEVTTEEQYCDGYLYAVVVQDLDGRWWSRLLPDASWEGAALELANMRTQKAKCLEIRIMRIKE